MLVLGGAGRLYGGLVGAAIFMIARDQFSGIAPQYWYFWIGILLVVVVIVLAQRHPRRPVEDMRALEAADERAALWPRAACP